MRRVLPLTEPSPRLPFERGGFGLCWLSSGSSVSSETACVESLRLRLAWRSGEAGWADEGAAAAAAVVGAIAVAVAVAVGGLDVAGRT
jgi:hypothetical protein